MEAEGIICGDAIGIGYRLGSRGEKRVHGSLSFSLNEGSLTCLLGPNGAGKSTLLRTLGGTLPPLSGRVLLQGKPMRCYPEQQRACLIGVVLTDKIHAGGLRVRELVALGRHPYTGFFGRLGAEDRRIVDESMEAVGVTAKADSYVSELSDGERQKAMIAKVLAQQCPVILLDEPTAFLDVISRIEVMNLLHSLARSQRKTILLSTHDIEQALRLSDRLWLLSRADGLLCGVTEDLVLDGSVDRFFGRGGISFDESSGSFRRDEETALRIGLRADSPALRFWAANALRRIGLRPVEAGNDGTLATLRARSPREIEVRLPEGTVWSCDSFSQVVERLKAYIDG